MNWSNLWIHPKPSPRIREDDDMIAFQVIGELRDNPGHLLLHGDDGRYYGYDLDRGEITPIDLDANWAVDLQRSMPRVITAPVESLAS